MNSVDPSEWMIVLIVVPLASAIISFVAARGARWIGLISAAAMAIPVTGLAFNVWQSGAVTQSIGGWRAPLGIELAADGLSVLMVALSAIVFVMGSLYGFAYFAPTSNKKKWQSERFWPLWMFLWGGLNALFLSSDLFNIYVTLEIVGLAAVPLVAMAGAEALNAAMRYLVVSLLGSLCYLFGVGIVYAHLGTLHLPTLASIAGQSHAIGSALAVMSAGLLIKMAVFPLHFWLPPAHANAPAPVSAVLSAVVVKAGFYLLLRLWFDGLAAAPAIGIAQALGVMGTAAIFWGSINALVAKRFKMLIAYSTVAQLGYLLLVFPLTYRNEGAMAAWCGALYFALSHAVAKASFFFSAGALLRAFGGDDLEQLRGSATQLPVATFAFATAAVSLIGLPPSGGFMAKWLLMQAAFASGQWWWALVIVAGGLLAAGYIFRFFSTLFAYIPDPPAKKPVPALMEWSALGLAGLSILLGLTASIPIALTRIGAPFSGPLWIGG
jgi:formate hydrogenlyase subunit 3/multisubunit Na+/H+ antiporter MnhD subunit